MKIFEPPDSRLLGNVLDAGVSKLSMYSYIGKLKEKWTHSDNKMIYLCYVRCIN